MSRQIALDSIHLRSTPRWGHTQYSLEYHPHFLAAASGQPSKDPRLLSAAYDALSIDLNWLTDDGLVDWQASGRITDMGHAAYASDASDQSLSRQSPFTSVQDVHTFDAVGEYGLPAFSDQVDAYENLLLQARQNFPGQLTPGGYYKTLVSGAIAAFGWEWFLLAATDSNRLERVLDTFFQRSLFFMRAWAGTSAEVVIQHDDFVWSSGPFLHPDFYRQAIIPRYAELWKPLHRAGKKVLFCADGLYSEFAGDIVAAGADGLIFEPCNDFTWMAREFGSTTCLVGSAVDCRDLLVGDWREIESTLQATVAALEQARGSIIAVGNHLPPDLPATTLQRFFDQLLPLLSRDRGDR
ncbi:hypothetical protein JW992_12020 [candidate division KSB1 bacterium]|nr:hypothetical protein [candidate division KSB1 bacterium]